MAAMRKENLHVTYPEPDPDYLDDDDNSSASHHHARQQQQRQLRSPGWRKSPHSNGAGASSDTSGEFPPPPPPLTAEELASAVSEAHDAQVQNGISPTASEKPVHGQIKPKPLHNPCLESKERQALHRELISNYKLGKDVLQKPELNKVMRERREMQRKKEWEEQKNSKGRTSLEVKLEERRIREEAEAKMKVIKEDESSAPELLRMHKKITHKLAGEHS